MTLAEARQLFDYGIWANGLFFDAAGGLTPTQRAQPITSSFPSVLSTLGHLVGAEWVWLRRWLGESPTSVPAWQRDLDLNHLRQQLSSIEVERAEWLTRLADSDLSAMLSYSTLNGQLYVHRLGDLVRHVVNHSTYHRGQLATQLRQLGATPPSTDFIRYLRETHGAS